MSNSSCHTVGVSSLESRTSNLGRGLSLDDINGFAIDVFVLFLGLTLRSTSPYASVRPGKLSLRRVPLVTGEGYEHSRPEFSHARHVVPTPLFTHLTLERRQRVHAMLERIRACCACLGEGPAAAEGCVPGGSTVAVIVLLGLSGA
jgi:hypothetical protein